MKHTRPENIDENQSQQNCNEVNFRFLKNDISFEINMLGENEKDHQMIFFMAEEDRKGVKDRL